MKIWTKILVTAIAGGLTYLLTKTTKQPEIWQLTMSVFVAGVVLVVQVLVETAEYLRRTSDDSGRELREISQLVSRLNAANSLLAEARDTLSGDSVEKLVRAAAALDPRQPATLSFADHMVRRLTDLLEGLKSGRAEYQGDDRDWLLGLAETASASIDATSMTTITDKRGFVDEGRFWASDLGRRYLSRQQKAIARGVRIRRVFLIDAAENPTDDQIRDILAPHRKINVDTRILRSADLDQELEGTLTDFILFDRQISYELHSAQSISKNTPPLLAQVALVVKEERVEERAQMFQRLWDAASDWTDPRPATGTTRTALPGAA